MRLSRYFAFSPPLIGLDIGREKLNMVQVESRSGDFRIVAAVSDYHDSTYEQLLEQPEQFQKLVKNALKKGRFIGRKVVATVPPPMLTDLFLNFQCKPQESETQAMLTALKHRVKDDLASYVIDYLPIRPNMPEQIDRTALVAMAKQDKIEHYLELLRGCGVTVEALEIGPVAIKRLISILTRVNGPEKVLTVNFGTQNSYLTVVWNNQLLLDRKIEFGMDNILNTIAQAFDINTKTAMEVLYQYGFGQTESAQSMTDDFEDDINCVKNVLADILTPCFVTLADAIKDVLVYVASETRGEAVELIYLMGSLARVSKVDDVVNRLISIPVRTINPFYGFSEASTIKNPLDDIGPLAGVAVATGLSMRGSI